MTNPNSAVGTNGAFGGRTSVNAFNDVLATFQGRGVLSGWGIVPSSGMTVSVGGAGTIRDVAVAEDTNGNKTTVNNISGAPISVTLDSAPASNSRYDAIVVYVDKPPVGNATQDNPECCGIIPVTGTAASTPAYPDDTTIRDAITADGASGATAYYAILGYVLVASGTTAITSNMISAVTPATITSDKLDWTTYQSGVEQIVGVWIDGKPIYRRVFDTTTSATAGSDTSIQGLTAYNVDTIVNMTGWVGYSSNSSFSAGSMMPLCYNLDSTHYCTVYYYATNKTIYAKNGQASCPVRLILYYTKTTD